MLLELLCAAYYVVCSLWTDQNLRDPYIAWQQRLLIDICCPRPTSAANPPAVAAAVDGTDRRDTRPFYDAATALRGPRKSADVYKTSPFYHTEEENTSRRLRDEPTRIISVDIFARCSQHVPSLRDSVFVRTKGRSGSAGDQQSMARSDRNS